MTKRAVDSCPSVDTCLIIEVVFEAGPDDEGENNDDGNDGQGDDDDDEDELMLASKTCGCIHYLIHAALDFLQRNDSVKVHIIVVHDEQLVGSIDVTHHVAILAVG